MRPLIGPFRVPNTWASLFTITIVTILCISLQINCDSSSSTLPAAAPTSPSSTPTTNALTNETENFVIRYFKIWRSLMFGKKSNNNNNVNSEAVDEFDDKSLKNIRQDHESVDDQIKESILHALRNSQTTKDVDRVSNSKSKCYKCSKNEVLLNEHEESRQRIEYIKEQILSKLGMKRPPSLNAANIDIDYNLYKKMINQESDFEGDDYHYHDNDNIFEPQNQHSDSVEDTKDILKTFILPISKTLKSSMFDLSAVYSSSSKMNVDNVLKRITILVHYNMTPAVSTEPSNVYSNYYYKTPNIEDETELIITAEPVEHENDISRNGYEVITSISALKKSSSDARSSWDSKEDTINWFEYDVTELFTFDYANSKIRIHNKNFDILSSAIVLQMFPRQKTIRSKRSIDCGDNVSFCCRQPFYINFTTIGWNNWILQPSGYNANYCKGKCDLSHARYHHTTVISKYPAIKLCCSPREMSSISLLYMDDKRRVYARSLSNMVVQSCDCA